MSFSQLIPIVTTIFASLVTVQLLYQITNQTLLLIIAFAVVMLVLLAAQDYIVTSLYPDRKDGKVHTRRRLLVRLLDFLASIVFIIITNLVYDVITVTAAKMTAPWYIVLQVAFVIIFFVFIAIISTEEAK